jgi:hypothetical protein
MGHLDAYRLATGRRKWSGWQFALEAADMIEPLDREF